MKKALALSIIAVMSLSCKQANNDRSAGVDESGVILDVRTAREYEAGHLKNAVNIPYTEIAEKIAAHVEDMEEEITVYCRSGQRSAIAKNTLDKMGYKHVLDAGAYAKLKAQEEESQED